MENGECRFSTLNIEEHNKKKHYKWGYVIVPKSGNYHKNSQTVYVLDVKSLYPTMMINNNIIFDTINCHCCKDSLVTQVSQDIMNLLNDNDNNIKQYWICKIYRGIVPRLFEQYRNERFRPQDLRNNVI